MDPLSPIQVDEKPTYRGGVCPCIGCILPRAVGNSSLIRFHKTTPSLWRCSASAAPYVGSGSSRSRGADRDGSAVVRETRFP